MADEPTRWSSPSSDPLGDFKHAEALLKRASATSAALQNAINDRLTELYAEMRRQGKGGIWIRYVPASLAVPAQNVLTMGVEMGYDERIPYEQAWTLACRDEPWRDTLERALAAHGLM